MGKQSYSIGELSTKVEKGEIRLPEMQRGYVWTATKVRDLLDSLYRGYPSGTILTWETDESVPTRDFSVLQEKNSYTTTTYQLLLDGQQRLTSLSAILRGELVEVRDRKRPIDILFNLEHPEEMQSIGDSEEDDVADASEDELLKRMNNMAFVVKSKRLEKHTHWVSVTEVLKSSSNSKFLQRCGLDGFDDPRYERYEKRLNDLRGIEKYKYDVYVLEREKTYEEATDIFVRVNSLGAKLKSSDLALAQITAKWRNSLAIFEQYRSECKDAGFDVGTGVLVRNLIVFATGQAGFKKIASLSQSTLQDSWEHSKKALNYAMNFLKSNVGIDSLALLSSPFILIVVAYFSYHREFKLSPKDERKLRYWVLIASSKGRFSRGSSDSLLDQDLSLIRKNETLDAMIAFLRNQFGRLEIEVDDLESKNNRSSYFKVMFLAFKQDGAKDWTDGLKLSLSHAGEPHKLQFHHIFPQSLLKKSGVDKQKVDDICNLAFIAGKSNQKINNKPPVDYLPAIVDEQGREALECQKIPIDPELWKLENYEYFLRARRKKVVERLNSFIDHESIKS